MATRASLGSAQDTKYWFREFHPKFEPPTLKQKTGLFFSVYDMHLRIAELVDGEVESISLGMGGMGWNWASQHGLKQA